MILVLAKASDVNVDRVVAGLERRGADVVRFEHRAFPRSASMSLGWAAGSLEERTLDLGGRRVDLQAVQAVWDRRPGDPAPQLSTDDPRAKTFATDECKSFLYEVWDSLDSFWLPAQPWVVQRAQSKILQLQLAAAIGFELPSTLVTNDPAAFLRFYRGHDGQVISKVLGNNFIRSYSDTFGRYTEGVSNRDVAHAEAVRYSPLIFQAYVPKRVELRVTVVGDRVFAAEIHSQQTNHTRHDWRRYDHQHTLIHPHALPHEIEALCIRLVRRLGLRFGGIDLIVRPDGGYVFLEINPSGQYLWLEELAGLPISDAICDLLASSTGGSP